MLRKCPLIVILGSTGTGKTKLSLEIAKKFKGEIIGADSMQVYCGLDIVTAKATQQERSQAVHHMLDVAQPGETFTVVHYKKKTLNIIDDLLSKNKIPIIVGGTNYYIESILWKVLVDPPEHENLVAHRPSLNVTRKYRTFKRFPTEVDSASDLIGNDPEKIQTQDTNMSLSAENKSMDNKLENEETNISLTMEDEQKWEHSSGPELHRLLKVVDPTSAQRLHPNNKRKIMRSLQILLHTGKTHSNLLHDQRNPEQGGCAIGGPLRFQNVVLIWLRCDQNVLDTRLDSRVDSMIEEGLIEELQQFRKLYIPSESSPDYTLGILQTIGLKEMTPYLEYIETNTETNPDQKELLLKNCLDNLKLVTRRYARKQNRWVRNRFLGYKDRQVPPLYALDTSDPSQWNEIVRDPALHIIESYISGVTPNIEPMDPNPNVQNEHNTEVSHFCDVCNRIFIGDYQWQLHQKSNKHSRVIKSKHKRIKMDSDLIPQPTAESG